MIQVGSTFIGDQIGRGSLFPFYIYFIFWSVVHPYDFIYDHFVFCVCDKCVAVTCVFRRLSV